jgi:hypothetical protein
MEGKLHIFLILAVEWYIFQTPSLSEKSTLIPRIIINSAYKIATILFLLGPAI